MNQIDELTEKDIRESLIKRARAFCHANKTSFSAIGFAAVKDSKFLKRVENPELNFNIKTYQKVVEWLDEAERQQEAAQ